MYNIDNRNRLLTSEPLQTIGCCFSRKSVFSGECGKMKKIKTLLRQEVRQHYQLITQLVFLAFSIQLPKSEDNLIKILVRV